MTEKKNKKDSVSTQSEVGFKSPSPEPEYPLTQIYTEESLSKSPSNTQTVQPDCASGLENNDLNTIPPSSTSTTRAARARNAFFFDSTRHYSIEVAYMDAVKELNRLAVTYHLYLVGEIELSKEAFQHIQKQNDHWSKVVTELGKQRDRTLPIMFDPNQAHSELMATIRECQQFSFTHRQEQLSFNSNQH
jgi:hypothetical protein